MNARRSVGLLLAPALLSLWCGVPKASAADLPSIVYPVQGVSTYTDSFGDPRSGGRTHEGADIMAAKMTPVVAAASGTVTFAPQSEPSYGYVLNVQGDDGYEYDYLHLNNDTPGTDDGQGGIDHAYAPGIERGVRVEAGQLIAYVGDSGNAEGVGSHLHFEIRLASGTAINPYPALVAAQATGMYDRSAVLADSSSINADLGLVAAVEPTACVSGSLIRAATSKAVYYCGADGRRYVFPSSRVYDSWYDDFSTVQVVSDETLAALRLGGNVTYRPGTRLVKIQTDPKVYAVDRHGTLRWIASPEVAVKHYGAGWAKSVEDIPDTFFLNYKLGEAVSQ